MTNKNELETIVIETPEDFKQYEGKSLSGKYIVMECVIKDAMLDVLERCIVEGGSLSCRKIVDSKLHNMEYVYGDEILGSLIEKCHRVQCGEYDDGYKCMANKFLRCGDITIDSAIVEDCTFDDFDTLFLTDTCMCGCVFSETTCYNHCAISMEDGEISGSCFKNIKLLNDSYLIEGFGDAYVNGSTFENIRTSREDRELFHMEETKGFIIKKKKEYSFVDESTCHGLSLIADLDGMVDNEV